MKGVVDHAKVGEEEEEREPKGDVLMTETGKQE
jgi:hypothetical protein